MIILFQLCLANISESVGVTFSCCATKNMLCLEVRYEGIEPYTGTVLSLGNSRKNRIFI